MHIRLTVLASPLKPEVIGTFTNSVLDIAHIDFTLLAVSLPAL